MKAILEKCDVREFFGVRTMRSCFFDIRERAIFADEMTQFHFSLDFWIVIINHWGSFVEVSFDLSEVINYSIKKDALKLIATKGRSSL